MANFIVFWKGERVTRTVNFEGKLTRESIKKQMQKGETYKAHKGVIGHFPLEQLAANVAEEILGSRQLLDIEEVVAQGAINASKIELPKMIDDPKLPFKVMKGVINPASLLDGRARAEELNRQYPGRKFRVPTEAELLTLNKEIGDQLEGKEFWIWTETKHENYPGNYVLRPLNYAYRSYNHPEYCYNDGAVRLVEDK